MGWACSVGGYGSNWGNILGFDRLSKFVADLIQVKCL